MHAWLHLYVGIQSTIHPHIYVHQTKLSYSPLTKYYCWNWQFKPKFLPNEKLLHFVFISSKSSYCMYKYGMLTPPLHLQHQRPRRALRSWTPKFPRPFGSQVLWRVSCWVWSKKEQVQYHEYGHGAISAELFSFPLYMNHSFSWPCKSKI